MAKSLVATVVEDFRIFQADGLPLDNKLGGGLAGFFQPAEKIMIPSPCCQVRYVARLEVRDNGILFTRTMIGANTSDFAFASSW